MAAFFGRKGRRRFGVGVTGWGIWAAVSGMVSVELLPCLFLVVSCCASFWGSTPAMDVSGMFVLRGGGGTGSRV